MLPMLEALGRREVVADGRRAVGVARVRVVRVEF